MNEDKIIKITGVDPKLKNEIKIAAIKESKSMKDFMLDLARNYLRKNK